MQITAKIPALLNKEVSLVMRDNTVAFGKVAELKPDKLKLETVKGKYLDFNFTEILEIVYDKVSN